jgi:hypothetical protein
MQKSESIINWFITIVFITMALVIFCATLTVKGRWLNVVNVQVSFVTYDVHFQA